MILYNGLTLAYIGDAYYELWIRDYCLQKGDTLVRDLHKRAILYTQATAQALAANKLVEEFYSEAEISIFKRGRNHSATHKPKNADVQTYNKSTGFEAVIGYLYLEKKFDRLEAIFNFAVQVIEENKEKVLVNLEE